MVQEALKRSDKEPSGFASMDDNAEKRDDVLDEHQLFYLAEVLVIQMSYPEFYDYLLLKPNGWLLYEELRNAPEEPAPPGRGRSKDEILKQYPDLAFVWRNSHLLSFMEGMSNKVFPPFPSLSILKKILRFTAIVERREYAESDKYEKKK